MDKPATVSAWTNSTDTEAAARDLIDQIGDATPTLIVFFHAKEHDGGTISEKLRETFRCSAVGCTTAGEISDHTVLERGVSAIAFANDKVRRAESALIPLASRGSSEIASTVRAAMSDLGSRLGVDLRSADPARFVGLVLIDGLSHHAEEINHALGTAAPGIMFVGGSAGDDLLFEQTRVSANGESTSCGAVLVLMEVAVPFAVTKTFSADPTPHHFVVTRASETDRIVYEIDDKPVIPLYAQICGVAPDQLDFDSYVEYPWAIVGNEETFLRSPKGVTPDGGLEFLCSIREGMGVTIMRQTPIIDSTAAAFDRAAVSCGGSIGAGLIFNCVYRRLVLDRTGQHAEFARLYEDFPAAGFHTYGESLIAHINQTCTALFFGK